ncbi:PP0621 family protein [Pelomonas sp. SE-A7]|uniref:PP0621 family protein n=1 Tax=Pelomonas sp. SE-A7 TaxID=3054953 RepID=UPI00259CA76D|nr:PP0621 family protein [Pelomonas sp. SE-A7]MDM4767656.1 PP0621 family protein [Pelomonas sp. SE-A7]
MFKFLLLLALVALVFWKLGAKRRAGPVQPPAPPPQPASPKNMVSCAQCGLHLPEAEAMPGRGGVFCSAAHRAAYEAAHGGE